MNKKDVLAKAKEILKAAQENPEQFRELTKTVPGNVKASRRAAASKERSLRPHVAPSSPDKGVHPSRGPRRQKAGSWMGHHVEMGGTDRAKQSASKVLADLKAMPKPNLPKSEMTEKAEHKDQIPGGKADKKQPKDFNQQALQEGTKVEREHTSDPRLAQEIAMDHLTEDPEYYRKLKVVEKAISNKGTIESLEKDQNPKSQAPAASIGRTKSGKSIGFDMNSKYSLGFTHQDHKDAYNAHYEAAQSTSNPKTKAHHMKMTKLHMQSAQQAEPKAPAQPITSHTMRGIHQKTEQEPNLIHDKETRMDNKQMLEMAKQLLKAAQENPAEFDQALKKAMAAPAPAPAAPKAPKAPKMAAPKAPKMQAPAMSKEEQKAMIKEELKADFKPKFGKKRE